MAGHSVREVASITGLTPAQVRGFVRAGLVDAVRDARGAYRIAFADLVLLRTARRLLDAAVPARRARRALRKLKSQLPASERLAGMRITADGAQVVIRADAGVWNAESGQGHFDFDAGTQAGRVAVLAGAVPAANCPADVPPSPGGSTGSVAREPAVPPVAAGADGAAVAPGAERGSDDWYNLGLDLEATQPDRAAQAYAESLSRDPTNADAHVNLGRLLQLVGRRREAARHYLEALRHAPGHELAHYNLGTVHDEQDLVDQAIACYRRAPSVPDAHYNLVRLYELLGDQVSAARHLRRYRQLDPDARD